MKRLDAELLEVEIMQPCPAMFFDVEDTHQNYGCDSMARLKLLPNMPVTMCKKPKLSDYASGQRDTRGER